MKNNRSKNNPAVKIKVGPNQKCVDLAEPYRFGAMHYSSPKPASGMLIAQYNYPLTYDKNLDHITSAYSDRAYSWDFEHCDKVAKEYETSGDWETFFRSVDPEVGLEFLVKFLKAENTRMDYQDSSSPLVVWTGWRVLGFVNRSNGFPLYLFSLFAKGEKSDTEVYSEERAPNVYPIVETQLTNYSYSLDPYQWNENICLI